MGIGEYFTFWGFLGKCLAWVVLGGKGSFFLVLFFWIRFGGFVIFLVVVLRRRNCVFYFDYGCWCWLDIRGL